MNLTLLRKKVYWRVQPDEGLHIPFSHEMAQHNVQLQAERKLLHTLPWNTGWARGTYAWAQRCMDENLWTWPS